MSARSVRVDLADRTYTIDIGAGVLDNLGTRTAALVGSPPHRAMLVIDTGVPRAHTDRAIGSLENAGYETARFEITPTERVKTLDTLTRLLDAIAGARLERTDPVVALGGGIVGDVAGFAAASYRRGVPVVQCPTTLLSMVDASVGGKTGVNLTPGGRLVKNMAGAFWQPRAVLADVATLSSLTERDYRCGLAECVKHGLLAAGFGDTDLLDDTESAAGALCAREEAALTDLIARNVAVKARVVEADEREESGARALLNLGHTFAHAFEPMPDLSPDGDSAHAPLLHGEAVALGLVAACALGAELGLCGRTLGERVSALLGRLGLPTRVSGLPESGEVIRLMGDDKKALGGALRFIVPEGTGRCRLVDGVGADSVGRAIDAVRA